MSIPRYRWSGWCETSPERFGDVELGIYGKMGKLGRSIIAECGDIGVADLTDVVEMLRISDPKLPIPLAFPGEKGEAEHTIPLGVLATCLSATCSDLGMTFPEEALSSAATYDIMTCGGGIGCQIRDSSVAGAVASWCASVVPGVRESLYPLLRGEAHDRSWIMSNSLASLLSWTGRDEELDSDSVAYACSQLGTVMRLAIASDQRLYDLMSTTDVRGRLETCAIHGKEMGEPVTKPATLSGDACMLIAYAMTSSPMAPVPPSDVFASWCSHEQGSAELSYDADEMEEMASGVADTWRAKLSNAMSDKISIPSIGLSEGAWEWVKEAYASPDAARYGIPKDDLKPLRKNDKAMEWLRAVRRECSNEDR